MGDTTASARAPPWTKPFKAIRATQFPSKPTLQPNLSPETLALIDEDAKVLSCLALIGFASTKRSSLLKIQD